MVSPQSPSNYQPGECNIPSNLRPRAPAFRLSTELTAGKSSISMSPNHEDEDKDHSIESEPERTLDTGEFEFRTGGLTDMKPADELFSEGKLLPLWQMQRSDHYELNKITLKKENLENGSENTEQINEEASRISWFLDDDPSPTPSTCTVLWKELLRLRKQRASTLSPPSSSSSGSSKTETSAADGGEEIGKKNKNKVVVKRIKRATERTRSASSIRRRPVFNLAVCIRRKNNVSPLFSAGNGNLES